MEGGFGGKPMTEVGIYWFPGVPKSPKIDLGRFMGVKKNKNLFENRFWRSKNRSWGSKIALGRKKIVFELKKCYLLIFHGFSAKFG